MKNKFLIILLALCTLTGFGQNDPKITLTGTNNQATIYRGAVGSNTAMLLPLGTHDLIYPDLPLKGRIQFNLLTNELEVHNGTEWVGAGSTTVRFGIEDNQMRGTDGTQYRDVFGDHAFMNWKGMDGFSIMGHSGIKDLDIVPEGLLFVQDATSMEIPELAGSTAIKKIDGNSFDIDPIRVTLNIDGTTTSDYSFFESILYNEFTDKNEYWYVSETGIIPGEIIEVIGVGYEDIYKPAIQFDLGDSEEGNNYFNVVVDNQGYLKRKQAPEGGIPTGLQKIGNSYQFIGENNPELKLPLGNYSIDMTQGYSSENHLGASGNYSFAVLNGKAIGNNSISINSEIAKGDFSIAIGFGSQVYHKQGIALGPGNMVGNPDTTNYLGGITIGDSNRAGKGLSIGTYNNAPPTGFNVLLGASNSTKFDSSIILGFQNVQSSTLETVVGFFSETISGGHTYWDSNDWAFRIGMGRGPSTIQRKDGFRIRKDGTAFLPQANAWNIQNSADDAVLTKGWFYEYGVNKFGEESIDVFSDSISILSSDLTYSVTNYQYQGEINSDWILPDPGDCLGKTIVILSKGYSIKLYGDLYRALPISELVVTVSTTIKALTNNENPKWFVINEVK